MCQHCYLLGGDVRLLSELAVSCSLPDQNDDIYVKRNAILFTTEGSELRCSTEKGQSCVDRAGRPVRYVKAIGKSSKWNYTVMTSHVVLIVKKNIHYNQYIVLN